MASNTPPPVERDEFRLCPTCRMPISVLATRCRHCGESVGRPRNKEQSLTIQDLGGESRVQYKPSGNVQEALEAFRAEVLNSQEAEQRPKERTGTGSIFGRRNEFDSGPGTQNIAGLPELDERSRELADIVGTTPSSKPAPTPPRNDTPWMRVVVLTGSFVAAVLLLYFGGGFAVATIQDYLKGGEQTVQAIHNPVPDLIAQNAEPLAVLRAALDALDQQASPENQAIAGQARTYFVDHVEKLLKADPWTNEVLREASRLTSDAAALDVSPAIQELLQRVRKEVNDYSLVLTKVDAAAGQATFKLNNPNIAKDEVTVSVGERVLDRFIVRNISANGVRLEDTNIQRASGGRMLQFRLLDQVRPG